MKYTGLLIIILLLFSCSSEEKKNENIPADSVLTEAEFEAVLMDIYLAEAFVRQKEREGKNNIYYSTHYYTLLFEKHNTDTLVLRNSYKYYANKPEFMKELNQRIVDSLVILETHIPAGAE